MEQQAARNLVEKVFNSAYSNENYIELISNILKSYDRDFREINLSNDQKIFSKFNFLGSYDANGDLVGIYEVELSNSNALNRARVAQRNLIANQLKNSNHSSALVSFFVENTNEWRFSYVKSEILIDDSSVRLKFIEELTPARRQSFIAGPNEGTHTAKKQILPSLYSDDYPKLKDIEQIFQIESVNDDFYDQYKELFLRLTEYLEESIRKDEIIAKDFEDKEVLPSDFAKKTLGQFVFLYFIQRKGWIKNKDNPSNIFSFNKLFDTRQSYGDNFFNDVMEPIFYESLAKKDPNYDLYPVLKSFDFPYLNGGLFEPLRGYDWQKTNLKIPDSFFKNENKTKEGDFGDGLLDVFNRFNFTVYENDSLEQDIAVDPEMLGKVFENLLEEEKREENGAFYTPRPIVQYMCQESLTEYLAKELADEISPDILSIFIKNHATLQISDFNETELSVIAENAIDLDQLLADVSVCDPAVGSGAFPMGMLIEIVGARLTLQPFLSKKQSIHELKLHTIRQSLYGVDIDPSAVEIARLRFWLSLIIEEDQPTPLPNLEHKLMQGNSLISSYQGIELFNEKFLADEDNRQTKLDVIDEEVSILQNDLKVGFNTIAISRVKAIKKRLISLEKQKIKIQKEGKNIPVTEMLFESDDVLSKVKKQVDLLQSKISEFLLLDENKKKEDLKKEIDDLKWSLIEKSVDNNQKAKEFLELKNKSIKPFFIWKLEFPEIFKQNDGFDIVIGNPPYIDSETMVKKGLIKEREFIRKNYKFVSGNWDIYIAFFERGLGLLKENGDLIFITPDKWISKNFGLNFRKSNLPHFKNITHVGRNVFKTAKVDSIITHITNNIVDSLEVGDFSRKEYESINIVNKNTLFEPYTFDVLFSKNLRLINFCDSQKASVKEFLECENACATSDCYLLKEWIEESPANSSEEYFKVVNTGTLDKYFTRWGMKPMTYLKDKYLKPVVSKKNFSNQFQNSYYKKTILPKLIIKGLTKLDVSLDLLGEIIPGKTTLIFTSTDIDKLKILSGILNSSLTIRYIKEKYSSSSYNGGINFTKDMLNNFPFPKDGEEYKNKILNYVNEILKNNNLEKSIELLESIDICTFLLYGFSYSQMTEYFPELQNYSEEKFKSQLI